MHASDKLPTSLKITYNKILLPKQNNRSWHSWKLHKTCTIKQCSTHHTSQTMRKMANWNSSHKSETESNWQKNSLPSPTPQTHDCSNANRPREIPKDFDATLSEQFCLNKTPCNCGYNYTIQTKRGILALARHFSLAISSLFGQFSLTLQSHAR